MARLLKYLGVKIWFIFLIVCLSKCETENPPAIIDYTGQKGSVMDIEGNIYQTIGIGTQIWMAENLATKNLNDGSAILQIVDDSGWAQYREPAYCAYNNDSINYKKTFGLLYNFYTVNTGLLCPVGWHVPSFKEWDKLAKFAGGMSKAGGKLKNMESPLWEGPNYGFTENYDFNALPGGLRRCPSGEFREIGIAGYWWTDNSVTFLQSDAVIIENSNTHLSHITSRKRDGINVRCIKNN